MDSLNARQLRTLRHIVDVGTGLAVHGNTARALERRGLVEIKGVSLYGFGTVCSATDAGRKLIWDGGADAAA